MHCISSPCVLCCCLHTCPCLISALNFFHYCNVLTALWQCCMYYRLTSIYTSALIINLQKCNLHAAPSFTRKLAYQTLFLPQLELAGSIWSPHQAYLIRILEYSQNCAARLIARDCNQYLSVSNIMLSLSLPSLESCQNVVSLCLLHKIIHSEQSSTLPLVCPSHTSRCLHNRLSVQHIFGRTNAFDLSALPRAIRHWNGLLDNIADINNTVTFRQKISMFG